MFTDTHEFLSNESHWWCKYQDLALAFSDILEFYDEQEIVQARSRSPYCIGHVNFG